MNGTQLDEVLERLISFANCTTTELDFLSEEEIKYLTAESSTLILNQDILLRLNDTFVVCGKINTYSTI